MPVPYHLAIVTTHPIQYQSEWYRALAAHPDLDLHVYYCHQATPAEQAGAGFRVEFEWDVPLLSGYSYTFLKNVADPPGHGRFSGFDTPEIRAIIRRREYDAVMVNGWHYKSAWQAIWACWRAGVKVAVRSDSHLHTRRSLAKRLVKQCAYPRFIRRFDGCLAVGKWSMEYFLHYGAEEKRIFFVPHAVNDSFFHAESERLRPVRAELRKNFGLDENAAVFMFAGKFIEKKRPMDFVRAIERAARRDLRIQGLMVGDGLLRPECEQTVNAHRIPVRFAGFLNQSKIASAYVASDALVLPSDGGETWGLVVNEAMACGRPCVVSDQVGCGPDLVCPNETGAIFPFGDVQALSGIMAEMAADPELMSGMGVAARRRLRNYSIPVAVEGVVQCVETMVGAKRAYGHAK
jgi:glycosyltransferase involved in cell wall biosynthesis